jgi:hypothetical protein
MRDNRISDCSSEKVSKFRNSGFVLFVGEKEKQHTFEKLRPFLPLSVQSEPKFGRILSKQSHFTHFISTNFEFCGQTFGPLALRIKICSKRYGYVMTTFNYVNFDTYDSYNDAYRDGIFKLL